MGLDMYLTRKKYIGAKWGNVKGKIDITVDGKHIPIHFDRVSYIEEEVGYWRKVNAIHKWFVENCQDGVDDCKEYWVEFKQLKELLELCKTVRDNPFKAQELLPTESGFFFGSTEYDEYYYGDIDRTIEILEAIIEDEETQRKNGFHNEFCYRASW